MTIMKLVTFSLAICCLADMNLAMPLINYKTLRKQILEYEQRFMLGGKLTLNDLERAANEILMKEKRNELEAGFKNPKKFAPSRNFIAAKKDIEESKVFKFIRKMPKGAVLHAHDSAMATIDYMYHNVSFRDDLYLCETNDSFKLKFFKKPDEECEWQLLKKVRQHPLRALEPVREEHFMMVLQQLYEDNVMYLEMRSTLPTLYDFDGTEYTPKDTVGIFKNVSERFKKDHPDFVGVKLIYAPQRFVNLEQAEEYIKTLKELQDQYPNFVAGFDLVGQEDKGKTLEYFSNILEKVAHDTKFFFHAGETNWFGSSTDENLVDAILLNTKRIGHGYALTNHPFLLEMTKQMDIAIEVNPISNQVLKLVDDFRNHAARRLFAEGYPVVISNDDPGFWGARGLTYDFYVAFLAIMSEHADLKSLKQLAINSLVYSSLDDEEKQAALSLWEHKWHNYMNNISNITQ
ncbi:adenosine deaminase isoform X2 [Lasioglossum baleicum]|uniref:adenosine deaminase isoform X2 n=1 Tax=Lasioglossum baleicum TaxID=434251 RepID=UPI003FCE7757